MSVSPDSWLITFSVPDGFATPRPGQFVNVAVSRDLTLRRPFSVAGIPEPGSFDILVKRVGRGTSELVQADVGDSVPVIGPLGNQFGLPEGDGPALLVAGGIGVAGLRLLAQELRRSFRRIHALVGARRSEELLHHLLPPPTGDGEILLEIATDDGSSGYHGSVRGLFEKVLDDGSAPAKVYLCGPRAMLDAAVRIVSGRGLPCEVLLEEMMACGTGACRGCVVQTRNGYRTVCEDGPVFDAAELLVGEPARA